ncbi:aspartate 1-decarboxylase [Alkalithermobacter paradoxus]|uniref:Aspartate 1-decarboxylase n=1 Tax=Alkalithermobacter paradoxus TaxID=29349 RepID=A0A1V4I9I6_9FIRM|nr:aspartate 1-decarboxylase precursor [[Clostridium] thermoalcaliphilum]
MLLTMLKAKIHGATVTEANLNYVGSITIDSALLKKSGILKGEKVQIVNNSNGARLETYVIEGEENSGIISLNGAAARLVQVGDKVIIMAYGIVDEKEAQKLEPKIVIVDKDNKVTETLNTEIHGEIK